MTTNGWLCDVPANLLSVMAYSEFAEGWIAGMDE